MKKTILILIVLLLLSACSEKNDIIEFSEKIPESMSKSEMESKTEEDSVQQMPLLQKTLERLRETELFEPAILSADFLSINTVYSRKNIDLVISGYSWSKSLYIQETEGNNEITLTPTGIGGLANVFEANELHISQGDFIEAYTAGHMGMGYLSLYSLDAPYLCFYTIEEVIDRHHESSQISPERINVPNLYIDEDGMARVSKIYDKDKLSPEYVDINRDGNTDIVLRGIQRIVVQKGDTDDTIEYETIEEYYCKYIYIYNLDTDSFEYSEEDSTYIQVI